MPKNFTTQDFIEQAKEVHGDKYDYSKVEYINSITKICIVCPIHGEFWQRPSDHIHNKCGCVKCSGLILGNTENFIRKACEVHGNKYDYSKVEYTNNKTKVCIVCPEHGEFWQRPNDHLSGYACPKCCNNTMLTTEEWVGKVSKIHNNKYDYSKVEYKGAHKKVCIICPEHGEFWQKPNNHNNGAQCPKCVNVLINSKMEDGIRILLDKENIKYERQKTFEWLKNKRKLFLDFYLPEYRVGIEVQGEQHFKAFDRFGGENGLRETMNRDKVKCELCEKHNIKMFYITKRKYNLDEIIEYIEENKKKRH